MVSERKVVGNKVGETHEAYQTMMNEYVMIRTTNFIISAMRSNEICLRFGKGYSDRCVSRLYGERKESS